MLAVQGRGVLRERVPDAALEEVGRPQGHVQVGKLVFSSLRGQRGFTSAACLAQAWGQNCGAGVKRVDKYDEEDH